MHDRPTGDATPTDREAERLSTKSDTAERLITSVLLQRQLCRNRKCADCGPWAGAGTFSTHNS